MASFPAISSLSLAQAMHALLAESWQKTNAAHRLLQEQLQKKHAELQRTMADLNRQLDELLQRQPLPLTLTR